MEKKPDWKISTHVLSIVASLAMVFSGFSIPLWAQNTVGRLNGQVADASSAVLPGASITAVQVSTSRTFQTQSDEHGFYVLTNLPIGSYRVTVEKSGFAKQVIDNLIVQVDQSIRLDLVLTVGATSAVVEVSAAPATLETEDASISGTMKSKQIAELPINGRDYGRFSLLTPGAVLRTGQVADITFNGLQSTNNQFTIDGIDATRVDDAYISNGSERGARLLTGSLDSIAEFKVLSSTYTADYGRAAGGIVNIVTKSGANDLHGSAFEFLRNDVFDAHNYFQAKGTPAPIRFNDFGGNITGPILRDRMFYFANYEGTRQIIGIVGSGTVLSSAAKAQALITSPAVASIVALMPTPESSSPYIGNVNLTSTSSALVDSISFMGKNHVREDTGSVRIDNNWGAKDSTFVRFNLNDSQVNGPLIGIYSTAFGLEDHQNIRSRTTNAAASETHIFSPRLINTALFGVQRYATSFEQGQVTPTITISGLNFSPGDRGVYGREPMDIQVSDSVTWVKGSHTLKFGAGSWYITEPFRGYISASSAAFASIDDFIHNRVTSATIRPVIPENTTKMLQIGTYFTDSWQLRKDLTFTLGMRWDWSQVAHDADGKAQVWTNRTNTLTSPGTSYYDGYYKNFAPRLGVVWSPVSRIVVRAGVGDYIQAFPIGSFYNKISNTVPGNATLSSANIPGLSYPLSQYISAGTVPPPTLTGADHSIRNPRNRQWTVGVGTRLTTSTALVISYVGSKAQNLEINQGVNFVNPVTGKRPYTAYSNITLDTFAAQAKYAGLQVSLKQAITNGLSAGVEYSWSHAMANLADAGIYGAGPQEPFNLQAEWGNASNDVRNNVSFNALYSLPFGTGKKYLSGSRALVRQAISGWSLAGLGIVRSGIASTVYLGTNTYGDGNTSNQRPNRVANTSVYGTGASTTSGAISYLNFSAFSLPKQAVAATSTTAGIPGDHGNSPRGVFYGPHFAQLDLSAIKDSTLHENLKLQFRGEIFNILNHPNFDLPSTSWVSSGTASFGLIQNTIGRSIGFGASRQIQLSLKVLF